MLSEMFSEETAQFSKIALPTTVLSLRELFRRIKTPSTIKLNVVQSIVGHMTPEMTKHYSDHASLEVKREKMQLLPDFMQMTVDSESLGNCSQDTEIQHLLQQIPRKYSPELRQLLDFIANNDVRAIIELRRALVS